MKAGRFARRAAALLACLASLSAAHPPGPFAVPVRPAPFLPVSSMWRGATLFGTGRPVSVHFVRSIADWANELAFMDGRTGSARPLMLYRTTGQRRTTCPDSGGLAASLGVRDSGEELVFRLSTLAADYAGKYCTGEACGPRYTGMNDAHSRFHSEGEFIHLQGILWAEMARLTAAAADSLPSPCAGTPRIPPGESGVLVSFNDGMNDTYGDLVIFVTGVEMDVERDPAFSAPVLPAVEAAPAACRVEAEAGGVAKGEAFQPRPMALPLSAIRPRASDRERPFFIDQEWRLRYPGRPDETVFPNGPEIRVATPGPFRFDLAFFTNYGGFVNRARGEVSAEMLRLAPLLPDGRRQVSLMWYPASDRGERASTGAYIVKGDIRTLASVPAAASDPLSACGAVGTRVLGTFGYLRR